MWDLNSIGDIISLSCNNSGKLLKVLLKERFEPKTVVNGLRLFGLYS